MTTYACRVVRCGIVLVVFGCATKTNDMDEDETKATEKMLGIAISALSTVNFQERSIKYQELPSFEFTFREHEFVGKRVPDQYESRQLVKATFKDGEVLAAYCGSPKDSIIHKNSIVSDLSNRRHSYAGHFYPKDIIVGKFEGGMVSPSLFFRDVGSHTTAPHALAVAKNGRAHLIVSDVFMQRENRLKTYWLIGNVETGKWEHAFLIAESADFTYWSKPKAASTKSAVFAATNVWQKTADSSRAQLTFYLLKPTTSLEKNVLATEDELGDFDVAGSIDDELMLGIFSTKRGVFMLCHDGKSWRGSQFSAKEITRKYSVSVESCGKNCFQLRLSGHKNRQFEISIKK